MTTRANPTDVIQDELREKIAAVEDFIDQPPRSYGPEPMEVRDYRHSLYRIWSPLRDAILARINSTPMASDSEMPTIWEDPAGKGYPCFERPMTPRECKETIDGLMARIGELEGQPPAYPDAALIALRDLCVSMLAARASVLRTPAGIIRAQWHPNDAEMVAGELDRQAAAIRALDLTAHPAKEHDPIGR